MSRRPCRTHAASRLHASHVGARGAASPATPAGRRCHAWRVASRVAVQGVPNCHALLVPVAARLVAACLRYEPKPLAPLMTCTSVLPDEPVFLIAYRSSTPS